MTDSLIFTQRPTQNVCESERDGCISTEIQGAKVQIELHECTNTIMNYHKISF